MNAISFRFYRLQRKAAPYAFISPFIILFCVFGLYPLVKSLLLSFYITSGPRSRVFVGWENFAFLFSDPDFHTAVKNTTIFALCSVFLQLPLSLGLAILLNNKLIKARNFFRFSFFSPHLFGQVFVAVLFGIIFAPQFGLLNRTLHFFIPGIPADTKWLVNPRLVMPSIILTSLWMYVGFNMIYFLAALQAVDKDLYDAAHVDGANAFQRFLHVTLPSIKPVAVFVMILSTIGSFQLFELPYVLLNQSPGPSNAGLTIVMYLYLKGFEAGDLGYASTIGWTLALGVFFVALAQVRFTRMWKREA
ncbi:sugar ABC transporter permease [Candidatus Sumerlaeota bacterium]|nr:sugar ABC transporter permease [Candidatus Sumerlaeota bacterium]